MALHHIFRPGLHVSFCTVDARFRTEAGGDIWMDFHPQLGPTFWKDKHMMVVDEDVDDHVWSQFDGWWAAKGRRLYRRAL